MVGGPCWSPWIGCVVWCFSVVGLVGGALAGNAIGEVLPKNNDLGDLGTGLLVVLTGAVVGLAVGIAIGARVCRALRC